MSIQPSVTAVPAARRYLPTANLIELAFERLSLAPVAAPASKRRPAGHAGLSSDSSASVRLVALSRLLATKTETVLEASASTATGAAFIAALQAVVLSVAVRVAGASPQLDETNVRAFFNLSASHIAQQRLYEGGWVLPSRLPHRSAKALLVGLLDALSAIRTTEGGHRLAQHLLLVPAPPYDRQTASQMAALMAAIELSIITALDDSDSSSNDGGSSHGGSSSTLPSPLPVPRIPVAMAVEIPTEVDMRGSLSSMARRLLESRLSRVLDPSEAALLNESLGEALSVLHADTGTARERMLASALGSALLTRQGSMLWASVVSAAESGEATSVGAFRAAVLKLASELEGAMLLSILE